MLSAACNRRVGAPGFASFSARGARLALKVEYYGLPQGQGFSQDPEVRKYGITQVPTGVVLLDGREIGRISGSQWRSPENRISELLASADRTSQ